MQFTPSRNLIKNPFPGIHSWWWSYLILSMLPRIVIVPQTVGSSGLSLSFSLWRYSKELFNVTFSNWILLYDIIDEDIFTFMPIQTGAFQQPVALTEMLTSVGGQKWKNIRSILTPIFTSGKLRQMMFIMQEASDTLLKKLETVADKGKAIDIHM